MQALIKDNVKVCVCVRGERERDGGRERWRERVSDRGEMREEREMEGERDGGREFETGER